MRLLASPMIGVRGTFLLLAVFFALADPSAAQTTSTITRESSFAYDSATGLLTQETVEPANASLSVSTTYTYDAFGNKVSAAASGQGVSTRTTTANFSANGQFKTSDANALNQSESWAYSASFGSATSHTGPNGVTTNWAYDTFGRQTTETRADGTKTVASYAYCSGVNGGTASCPANGAILRQVTPENSTGTQIGPTVITYYDALSRPIGTQTLGFDSSAIATTMQYDANGRVAQTSRPYFVNGGTPKYTVNTYDTLGRATKTSFPNGGSVTYVFHGLSTSATNDHNQTTTTVNNAQGLKAAVTDAAGNTTNYAYDAEGDLTAVTDPNGNVTTTAYDTRGRKTASSDPDMGHWTYSYDVFGELVSQTDAKNQTTTLAFDALGRVTSRTEVNFTSTLTYDTAANGIGKPASSTTGANNSKSFTYDTLGRETRVTLTIAGKTYSYTTSYDGNGRLASVTYPSGFVANYVYTPLSYLSKIVDNASGTAVWTANARDAELHLLQSTAGNGVVTNQVFDGNTGLVEQITAGASNSVANLSYGFDTLGNLTSRSDTIEGLVENFCYDGLNRLTNYALGGSTCTSGNAGLVKTVAYDALGNITSKSDVGQYGYGNGAGPHAVSFVAGSVNGVVDPGFSYDANGNMTAGDGRTVAYTAFNMAAQVTQGSATLAFTYDSEHARIVESAPSGTTTYLNDPGSGAASEQFVSATATTFRDYIKADGHIVAVRFAAAGAVSYGYFTLDHLGSVAVITDQTGSIVERLSYDAWGRRRNANGTDNPACAIASETTRGFTGQEEMDQVCLVNMNARLYDPTLGRFMSADPTIEAPFIPQDLNRYSYVGNNPLSFTDPTGLCFLGCFWKSGIFRDLIAIAVVFVFQQYQLLPALEGAAFAESAVGIVLNGGILGGIGGAIATGTAKGAALGFLEGALFAEAGNILGDGHSGLTLAGSHDIAVLIGHGLVGGIVSEVGGGRFFSGFLAAGIGSLGPSPTFDQTWDETAEQTVEHAVLGGLGSVLGGGKFQNGAITSAFGYLLNAVNHMIAGSIIHQQIEAVIAAKGNAANGEFEQEYSVGGSRTADLYNSVDNSVYEIKPDTYESGVRYQQALDQIQSTAESFVGGHPGIVSDTIFEGEFTTAGYIVTYDGDVRNPYSGLIFYSIEDRSSFYSAIQNGLNQGWRPGSYSNPAPIPGLPPFAPVFP